MGKTRLIDQIATEIPSKGPKPLMERLPPDLWAEVCEVRDAWRARTGAYAKATKTSLGELLAKHLKERGVVIGSHAVQRWLTES